MAYAVISGLEFVIYIVTESEKEGLLIIERLTKLNCVFPSAL